MDFFYHIGHRDTFLLKVTLSELTDPINSED